MVTISSCADKKSLKLFENLPETIHRNDPYFVPPFPGSICKIFSDKSPYKRHGELLPFVAYKDGEPVGRIAAVVNRGHNEYYKDQVGFFGFFDCIDDVEVGKKLIDTAKDELRKRGFTTFRGPTNPTSNDEMGLLVDGFDSSPFVMMPYNPSYYVKLYEQLGLKPSRDFLAFYISATDHPPERIKKIVDRVKRTTGLTVRNVDLKNLKHELKIIRGLYNVTLDRNWGFVPITDEDMDFAAEDLKAIVDPSLVLIAEKNGEPAGFSLTIPNVNEFMFRTRGNGPAMRALKFIWYLKTSHPTQARLAVLGVKPEYRNTGISALFYYESLVRGSRKYIGGELSWIENNNQEIIKGITVMGGRPYKSYRIYETSLTQ